MQRRNRWSVRTVTHRSTSIQLEQKKCGLWPTQDYYRSDFGQTLDLTVSHDWLHVSEICHVEIGGLSGQLHIGPPRFSLSRRNVDFGRHKITTDPISAKL